MLFRLTQTSITLALIVANIRLKYCGDIPRLGISNKLTFFTHLLLLIRFLCSALIQVTKCGLVIVKFIVDVRNVWKY